MREIPGENTFIELQRFVLHFSTTDKIFRAGEKNYHFSSRIEGTS